MSSALQVCAFLMLTSAATAEIPADVTFTLATKGGQTAFRIGEPVDIELRFHASTPGRYQVTTLPDKRVVRTSLFDHFAAEPEAGAVDPLRDIPAQMVAGGSLAGRCARWALTRLSYNGS